jgi:hypothetical protein
MLSEGLRVAAVGGSDYHGRKDSEVRLGEPTTWIRPRSRSPECLVEAIRLGRTFVTRSPEGPRIDIVLAKGSTAYSTGDTVSMKNRGESFSLRAEISSNKEAGFLRLITAEGIIYAQAVREGSTVVSREIALSWEHKFLRAELGLFSDPLSPLPKNSDVIIAVTSPIYISKTFSPRSLDHGCVRT